MARLASFGWPKLFLPSDQGPVEGDDGVSCAKHGIVFLHESALRVQERSVGKLIAGEQTDERFSPSIRRIESGVDLGPDHEVIVAHRLGPRGGIVEGDAAGQFPILMSLQPSGGGSDAGVGLVDPEGEQRKDSVTGCSGVTPIKSMSGLWVDFGSPFVGIGDGGRGEEPAVMGRSSGFFPDGARDNRGSFFLRAFLQKVEKAFGPPSNLRVDRLHLSQGDEYASGVRKIDETRKGGAPFDSETPTSVSGRTWLETVLFGELLGFQVACHFPDPCPVVFVAKAQKTTKGISGRIVRVVEEVGIGPPENPVGIASDTQETEGFSDRFFVGLPIAGQGLGQGKEDERSE